MRSFLGKVCAQHVHYYLVIPLVRLQRQILPFETLLCTRVFVLLHARNSRPDFHGIKCGAWVRGAALRQGAKA